MSHRHFRDRHSRNRECVQSYHTERSSQAFVSMCLLAILNSTDAFLQFFQSKIRSSLSRFRCTPPSRPHTHQIYPFAFFRQRKANRLSSMGHTLNSNCTAISSGSARRSVLDASSSPRRQLSSDETPLVVEKS
jgi:hypothetical protein